MIYTREKANGEYEKRLFLCYKWLFCHMFIVLACFFLKNVKSFSKPSLIIRSVLKPGFVGEGISDIELERI